MIVYKVIYRDSNYEDGSFSLRSAMYNPFGHGVPWRAYVPGTTETFRGAYGALVFINPFYAKEFIYHSGKPQNEIWEAEAELMSLPPAPWNLSEAERIAKEFIAGDKLDIRLAAWPAGTLMCRSITLLKKWEGE
jgi:hypothetical protein